MRNSGLALLLVLFLALTGLPAMATGPLPDNVWSGKTNKPQDGLPDGHYAIHKSNGKPVAAAWYGTPTTRYRHAILGDAIEAGSLHVALPDGQTFHLDLPDDQVFEDRTPRIADLDGDGLFEIVTIRSFSRLGGSIALYGIRDGDLIELAATEPIGRANRWLNVAGIADYASRGTDQIAYVETPHIGGTLYFVEWRGRKLVPVAALRGFSNHKIGSRWQNLSADIDYDGNGSLDIAVPSNDRRTLRIVGFESGQLTEHDRFTLLAEIEHRSERGVKPGCIRMRLVNGAAPQICPTGN